MNFISSDSFMQIADYVIEDRHSPINIPFNRDGIIFCNTHRLNELFQILKDNTNRFVLITHLSDYNIEPVYLERKPECIKHWFAQNLAFPTDQITPIPIGVFTHARNGHYSNPMLIQAFDQKSDPKYQAFFLTCINTNLGERERAWEYSRRLSNSLVYQNERFPIEQFIQFIAQSEFVISPPGYGIDCFRTWEALYVGRIPVVRRSSTTEYFASMFPISIVDIWEDLTDDFLNQERQRINISDNSYREKLDASFWTNMITDKMKEIVN